MQVKAIIKIFNFEDEVLQRYGLKKPEEVRNIEVECLADSGATHLTLPEELIEKLGLISISEVKIRYADGRTEERKIYGGARVEFAGRTALTNVLKEKKDTRPLLGHVEMELMDLIVVPKDGRLKPRDESSPLPLIEQLEIAPDLKEALEDYREYKKIKQDLAQRQALLK